MTLHTPPGLMCVKQIELCKACVLHKDIRRAGDKSHRSFTEKVNLGLGFLIA